MDEMMRTLWHRFAELFAAYSLFSVQGKLPVTSLTVEDFTELRQLFESDTLSDVFVERAAVRTRLSIIAAFELEDATTINTDEDILVMLRPLWVLFENMAFLRKIIAPKEGE